MNLNPLGVFAMLAGIVLVYAAVKNKYPQDVIREALGKPALKGPLYIPGDSFGRPIVPTQPSGGLPPATGVPVVTV